MGDPLRFRDDEPPEEPAVTLDAFLDQSNATAVRLEAGDDVRLLLPVSRPRSRWSRSTFPRFRDGRGYSAARILREAGYTGETPRDRATCWSTCSRFMRRCGFDSFAPEVPIDAATSQAALDRYADVYQHAADGACAGLEAAAWLNAARSVDRDRHRPALHRRPTPIALERAFRGRRRGDDAARAARRASSPGDVAVVSSFGAESAVLLHLVAQVDPTIPVIFLDTQKMFPETLAYRDELVERLGLTDLRVVHARSRGARGEGRRPGCAGPTIPTAAARSARSSRWPSALARLRRVDLRAARRSSRSTRSALPRFEIDGRPAQDQPARPTGPRTISTPISPSTTCRATRSRPQGYLSIGCAPCTSKVAPGEDPRAGRWRGWDKTECGIHRAGRRWRGRRSGLLKSCALHSEG